MRKSFILHIDSLGILEELTDEQAGQLFKLIAEYHNPNKTKQTQITQLVNLAFYSFKSQFERDLQKYDNVVNRNRNNGKNGGRPKKENPEEPKKPDNKNNNKNNNDNKNNIDLSFVDFEYLNCFELWLEYKKNKNQKYKTQKSLEICYKNLLTISNNDPDVARQIIENSIANNYSGLFPLKQNNNQQIGKAQNFIQLYNQIQDDYANKPVTGKKFGEL
jgi:hypothetical protein